LATTVTVLPSAAAHILEACTVPNHLNCECVAISFGKRRATEMTNISANKEKASAGDPIPPKCAVIEVHLGELKQLFDAIDPSPFRDRDLDPKAEEFIVGWAKDLPRDAPLALVVDLDREAGLPDETAVLRDAIHEFFRHRAETFRQRLRELFRVGRTSLVIGLVALAGAIALGDFLGTLMKGSRIGEILRESLTIGGWVSMWRPLEVFLYDWWPIRNEARLGWLPCPYESGMRLPRALMPGERIGRPCHREVSKRRRLKLGP
jgi:hypothetical protein